LNLLFYRKLLKKRNFYEKKKEERKYGHRKIPRNYLKCIVSLGFE